MRHGNHRHPDAGYKYWAHEARRRHGRDKVDDFEDQLRNLLYGVSDKMQETMAEFLDKKLSGMADGRRQWTDRLRGCCQD